MILLVTPTDPTALHGNGTTGRRWAEIIESLGHPVRMSREYVPDGYEALVALHARKSADSIRAFRVTHPHAPVVLALTGTDLYPDLASSGVEPAVLDLADRIVVLQPRGLDQLDRTLQARAQVIFQSMPDIPTRPPREDCFEIAFLAHARPVKDPLRLATAVRALPSGSRIRVTHVGGAGDPGTAAALRAEQAANPRYDWLGPLPRPEALAVLARSRLLALTSLDEGGANVITEALAAGVPVVSSAIPGSTGLLGDDYPGYYPPGDTARLTGLLDAVEQDRDGLLGELRRSCAVLRPLVDPAAERGAWARLLAELPLPTRS